MKIRKRNLFRLAIDISDKVNIWFQDVFGFNAKRKVLEKKQDFVTMKELDNTIGKSLGIKQNKYHGDLFMTITIFICVAIAAYWFISRNNKKNKPDEEDSYDGPKMARQAEKDYTSRWSSNFDVTDEQYKLTSNTENTYKSAAETDYKTYEEPLIDNKRIQKTILKIQIV